LPFLLVSALAAKGLVLASAGERLRSNTAPRSPGRRGQAHLRLPRTTGKRPTLQSLAGALEISGNEASELLNDLDQRGLVTFVDGGALHLTDEGRSSALHVLRAHRLWERYLADETGFEEVEWHDRAERYEHRTSADELDELAAQLGHPTHDPHGDPIPTASGRMIAHNSRPLTALKAGETGRIAHIEDEPETVYAQLVAEGLFPGQRVRIIENTPQRIRFWGNGDEHLLAPVMANNLAIVPLLETAADPMHARPRLTTLAIGERGRVLKISRACRGVERRRLMDLGILPGTVITAEFISPSGDPTAYRVRDTLIGLRSEQADLIYIDPVEPAVDTPEEQLQSAIAE
jgi:DtxR family Mn-dependent transcriptional regulator